MITTTAQSRFVLWPRLKYTEHHTLYGHSLFMSRDPISIPQNQHPSIHPAWNCPWWINPNWHVITRDSFFFFCCSYYVDDGDFGTHSWSYPSLTVYFGRDNTFNGPRFAKRRSTCQSKTRSLSSFGSTTTTRDCVLIRSARGQISNSHKNPSRNAYNVAETKTEVCQEMSLDRLAARKP